ncbi:MAG: hypothetical protein IT290_00525, partial [Deltaproteobacteria bacterium]|nr:hypothetical protein [Deltaproteobacteria bacterium]
MTPATDSAQIVEDAVLAPSDSDFVRDAIWTLLALAWAGYLAGPIFDPPIFGALVRGNWILARQALPTIDTWSLAGSGLTIANTTWLFDIVATSVQELFGDRGLAGLKFFSILSAILLLAHYLRLLSGEHFIARLTALAASSALFFSGGFTPFTFALPFWIVVAGEIATRAFRPRSVGRALGFGLCLLSALIASNLHHGYIGAVLVGTLSAVNFRRRLDVFGILVILLFAIGAVCTPNAVEGVLHASDALLNQLQMESSFASQAPLRLTFPQAFLFLFLFLSLVLSLPRRWPIAIASGVAVVYLSRCSPFTQIRVVYT